MKDRRKEDTVPDEQPSKKDWFLVIGLGCVIVITIFLILSIIGTLAILMR